MTATTDSSAIDLVDLAVAPPGKRHAYAAARAGKIPGAKKVKRRWFAPRKGYDAWVEAIAVTPTEATDKTVSYIDGARERLGLRRVG